MKILIFNGGKVGERARSESKRKSKVVFDLILIEWRSEWCLPRNSWTFFPFVFSWIGGLWAVAPPMAPPRRENKDKKERKEWMKWKRINLWMEAGAINEKKLMKLIDWSWCGQAGMTNQAEARQAPTNSIQLFFLPLKREEKWMNLIGFFSLPFRFQLMPSLHPSTIKTFLNCWLDSARERKTNNLSFTSSIHSREWSERRLVFLSLINQFLLRNGRADFCWVFFSSLSLIHNQFIAVG